MKSNCRQQAPFIRDAYPLRVVVFSQRRPCMLSPACTQQVFQRLTLSHTHRHNIPCTDISPYHNRHGWLTGLKKNQWPFYRHVKYTFLSTSTTAATTTMWLNRIAQVTYTRTGSWWGETVKSKKSPRNARSRRISSEELSPCWLSLIANSFYTAGQDIQCTRY